MDKEESKIQSKILIGTGLIILGVIIVMIALRTPRIAVNTETVSATAATETTTVTTESTAPLPDYPLDLNTATAEDFMTIDGVGEHKAKLIVAYREQNGEYTDIYQLTNIKGFTPEFVDSLKPYITV
ncbi:MAG: helix-hairpin-helix domain-containing protein [Eubacterium sp.]|nr:helix-hairpin-helix domain-containing protein [Eubacterium sp.]